MVLNKREVFTQMKNLHIEASTGVWKQLLLFHVVSKALQTSGAPGSLVRGASTGREATGSPGSEAMTREIPSPIGLQFNVKSTRAIPGGLEPALGTVLKCEIFGHYGRLCQEAPWFESLPPITWSPPTLVVPMNHFRLEDHSPVWCRPTFGLLSEQFSSSVTSGTLQCPPWTLDSVQEEMARDKGMNLGFMKICRICIIILQGGNFLQLSSEKLVSETLESLLHGQQVIENRAEIKGKPRTSHHPHNGGSTCPSLLSHSFLKAQVCTPDPSFRKVIICVF